MRGRLLGVLWVGAAVACGPAPEPAPLQPWEQGAGGESPAPAPASTEAGAGDAPEGPDGDTSAGAAPRAPETSSPGDGLARWADAEPIRTLRGRASYYADSLAGNHTANGDVYDPAAHTAASRTLPFGTVLRVTRVDNGQSTLVRVNDRGPFGDHGRILDLSRAAAEDLDMIRAGVVQIRAEILHQP